MDQNLPLDESKIRQFQMQFAFMCLLSVSMHYYIYTLDEGFEHCLSEDAAKEHFNQMIRIPLHCYALVSLSSLKTYQHKFSQQNQYFYIASACAMIVNAVREGLVITGHDYLLLKTPLVLALFLLLFQDLYQQQRYCDNRRLNKKEGGLQCTEELSQFSYAADTAIENEMHFSKMQSIYINFLFVLASATFLSLMAENVVSELAGWGDDDIFEKSTCAFVLTYFIASTVLNDELVWQMRSDLRETTMLSMSIDNNVIDSCENDEALEEQLAQAKKYENYSSVGEMLIFSILSGIYFLLDQINSEYAEKISYFVPVVVFIVIKKVTAYVRSFAHYSLVTDLVSKQSIQSLRKAPNLQDILAGPAVPSMVVIVLTNFLVDGNILGLNDTIPAFIFGLSFYFLKEYVYERICDPVSATEYTKEKLNKLIIQMQSILDVDDRTRRASRFASAIVSYALSPNELRLDKKIVRYILKEAMYIEDEEIELKVKKELKNIDCDDAVNAYLDELTELSNGPEDRMKNNRDAFYYLRFIETYKVKSWLEKMGSDGVYRLLNSPCSEHIEYLFSRDKILLSTLRFNANDSISIKMLGSIRALVQHRDSHAIANAFLDDKAFWKKVLSLFENTKEKAPIRNDFYKLISSVLLEQESEEKGHHANRFVQCVASMPKEIKESLARYWLENISRYERLLKPLWLASHKVKAQFLSPEYSQLTFALQPTVVSAYDSVFSCMMGQSSLSNRLDEQVASLSLQQKQDLLCASGIKDHIVSRMLLNSMSDLDKSVFLSSQYKKVLHELKLEIENAFKKLVDLVSLGANLLIRDNENKTVFDHIVGEHALRFDAELISQLHVANHVWLQLGFDENNGQANIEDLSDNQIKNYCLLYEKMRNADKRTNPISCLDSRRRITNPQQAWQGLCERSTINAKDCFFTGYQHGDKTIILKVEGDENGRKQLKNKLNGRVVSGRGYFYICINNSREFKLSRLFKKEKAEIRKKKKTKKKKKKDLAAAIHSDKARDKEQKTTSPTPSSPSMWDAMTRAPGEVSARARPDSNRNGLQVPTGISVRVHTESKTDRVDTQTELSQFIMDYKGRLSSLSEDQCSMYCYVHRSGAMMYFIQMLEKLKKSKAISPRVRNQLFKLRNNVVHHCKLHADTPLDDKMSTNIFTALKKLRQGHHDDASTAEILMTYLSPLCDASQEKPTAKTCIALRVKSLKALHYLCIRLEKNGLLSSAQCFSSFDKTADLYAVYYHAAMLVEAEKQLNELKSKGASIRMLSDQNENSKRLMRTIKKVRNKLCHETEDDSEYVLLNRDNMNCLATLLCQAKNLLVATSCVNEATDGSAHAAAPTAVGACAS